MHRNLLKQSPAASDSFPEQRLSLQFFRGVNVCYARIYHRLEVQSPCRLPKRGSAILACNHTSGLDPLLVQSLCPRLIVWMIAREYYELRALKWLFELIEAIPVDRSGRDLASTRQAMRALHDGRILGMFPEGRIERTRDLLPFHPGVALLAMKTGAPVYPVYLDGTQRGSKGMFPAFAYPHRSSVAFGEALRVVRDTSEGGLDGALERIRGSVRGLRQKFPPATGNSGAKKGDKFSPGV